MYTFQDPEGHFRTAEGGWGHCRAPAAWGEEAAWVRLLGELMT